VEYNEFLPITKGEARWGYYFPLPFSREGLGMGYEKEINVS
jgi:hypothetical protein